MSTSWVSGGKKALADSDGNEDVAVLGLQAIGTVAPQPTHFHSTAIVGKNEIASFCLWVQQFLVLKSTNSTEEKKQLKRNFTLKMSKIWMYLRGRDIRSFNPETTSRTSWLGIVEKMLCRLLPDQLGFCLANLFGSFFMQEAVWVISSRNCSNYHRLLDY